MKPAHRDSAGGTGKVAAVLPGGKIACDDEIPQHPVSGKRRRCRVPPQLGVPPVMTVAAPASAGVGSQPYGSWLAAGTASKPASRSFADHLATYENRSARTSPCRHSTGVV